MISRVADNCFWITRYLERVDTMARLLAVSAEFHLDSGADENENWKALVIVAGAEEDYVARVGAEFIDDAERVQEYLTWDQERSVSIYASLRAARENARIIRDVLSLEMWEQINDLWLWLNQRSTRRLYDRDRDSFYDHLCKQCMLFHGIAYSLFPWLIMEKLTIWDAAAAPESLLVIFIGAAVVLPVVVAYSIYVYRVFGGKASPLEYC